MDLETLSKWLATWLPSADPDCFRMKGLIQLAGKISAIVLQSVHMLLMVISDRSWKTGERRRT